MSEYDYGKQAPDQSAAPSYQAAAQRAPSLEEAREAYVQKNFILYHPYFAEFDRQGGFLPTWTWWGFFGGVFWFLYRKMYVEALVIFVANFAIGTILDVLPIAMTLKMGVNGIYVIGVWASLGLCGRWLYWKSVDRKLDEAQRLYGQTENALIWLRSKGGVNGWVIPLFVVLVGLAVLLVLVGIATIAQQGGLRY